MTFYEVVIQRVNERVPAADPIILSRGLGFLIDIARELTALLQSGELSSDAVLNRENATSVATYDEVELDGKQLTQVLSHLGESATTIHESWRYRVYLSET